MKTKHVSGFVSLIGRPNVGKSTLLNTILGEKISIVTDKIQTTRQTVQGIITKKDMQVVFLDTPGFHKPKHKLGNIMVQQALQTLQDVDLILFMINAKEGMGRGDQFIINRLRNIKKTIFLVINKIDLVHPDDLLPLIDTYIKMMDFTEVIPISAKTENNLDTLMSVIKDYLPEGPRYYSEEDLTNQSQRFIFSEYIREKILYHTEEEVPHSVNVLIDTYEDKNNSVYIQASIIVERPSQKGIIIGKRGSMLKKVGKEARLDIEQFLNKKVYLDLWVRVEKDWRNKKRLLADYGYEVD